MSGWLGSYEYIIVRAGAAGCAKAAHPRVSTVATNRQRCMGLLR